MPDGMKYGSFFRTLEKLLMLDWLHLKMVVPGDLSMLNLLVNQMLKSILSMDSQKALQVENSSFKRAVCRQKGLKDLVSRVAVYPGATGVRPRKRLLGPRRMDETPRIWVSRSLEERLVTWSLLKLGEEL